MIKEVDKICPEGGILDSQTIDLRQLTEENGTNLE
jgi:hypothetical protein